MLKFSSIFKRDCKRSLISPNQRAMADLMIMGWSPMDAYIALGLCNPSFSDDYNTKQMDSIISDNRFLDYMRRKESSILRGNKNQDTTNGDGSLDIQNKPNYRSKDEVIDALVSTVADLKGKEKADVLMKIADLQQMKKEETIEEDNTIHFYVPISCTNCSLYINASKRIKDKTINDNNEIK